MKKLISIVLTICMLFSLITVTASAEISEDERLELLKEKDYTYIDINPNIDAFASAKVIRDYAVFDKVESSDSTSAFNELHTVTDGANTYTYRTRIPSKTHDGIAIDGTESYYYKGVGYFNIDEQRIYSTVSGSPILYATESFKLSAEEQSNLKLNYYKSIAAATTAKMVAAAPDTYTSATFSFNNSGYIPNVEKIEEAGSNYNVFIKDSDTDAKFRIGPLNDKEYVKNSVDYVKGGTHTVTLPAGTKGDSISIAATAANINDGGTVSAFKLTASAALLSVEIKYKGGETETKYVVITGNNKKNDLVGASIVYGDKYSGSEEIDYSVAENTQKLAFYTDSGLTLEDVIFPSNVSGGEMNFAVGMKANQHSNYTTAFSNEINVGTFELKDDEISSIKFVNDQAPGDNAIDGIISFDRDGGTTKNVRALIPVQVKNGDSEKAYFLYVARISQQPAVFGATIINKSLQEKIDAINEKLALVDENTTEADCEAIDKEITALKAESDLVKDSDFNEEKYELVKAKLLALAQRKIAAVEASIEGLADSYTYSMKDNLLSVYADYTFLLSNGVEETAVNEALRNKLKALYADYEKADALEKAVAGWGKYSYTMYDEVVKANESLAEMENKISETTSETIKEYYETATTAKAIDDKIDALSDKYDSSMLEEVLAIKADVNKFIEDGGSEDAFEYISKLKKLVDDAAKDVLDADIKETEKKIQELPAVYSTALNEQLAEILTAIESIEERGRALSTDAENKLDKLVAQKNESPVYITTSLNYTRDVFEDVKLYAGQGYADTDKGVYVYPTGAWSPTVSSVSGTSRMALDESGFVSQLYVNSQNVGTVNGIPYQFGPVISKVHGETNDPNSINAADCSSIIEIAVEELPYEELYLAAWAKNDKTSATITYTYADGSTSTEKNVTAIKGGYLTKQEENEYASILNAGGILYWRAYNSTSSYDQKVGYGSYSIYVTSHRLTPDDKKALKSVKIQVTDNDVNVFALTGKVSNSGIISGLLDETIASLANENTDSDVRKLVSDSKKYMEILDDKEVTYNSTYAATVQQYSEEYITVESIECYTALDNRNITVTFSGAISEDSITKENFVLKKDGNVVSDYEVTKISDKVIKITVKNRFDYDSDYSLEINANVINDEKTVTLGTTKSYEYDGLAAVDVKITYKDNKIAIYLKNNLNKKLENFVVMTGAFDKDNALIKFEPVSGSLEAGDEFNRTIDFNTDAVKINCEIMDTLDNAKLIYNHITAK